MESKKKQRPAKFGRDFDLDSLRDSRKTARVYRRRQERQRNRRLTMDAENDTIDGR